jgi:hypothetical protein
MADDLAATGVIYSAVNFRQQTASRDNGLPPETYRGAHNDMMLPAREC